MVNDSSRLFERSSATAILPRRGADMHAATVVVATAAASITVRSPALLFTAAFHFLDSRVMCQ